MSLYPSNAEVEGIGITSIDETSNRGPIEMGFVGNHLKMPGFTPYPLRVTTNDAAGPSDGGILASLRGQIPGTPRYRVEIKVIDLWDTSGDGVEEPTAQEVDDDGANAWHTGRELLADAITDAKEDGYDEPDGEVIINTGTMFGMVKDLVQSHDVESVVTDDGDALTYVTDARKNYVMFNCTASKNVGVHFNIRSHQVFDSPDDVPEDFIRTLVRSLKTRPPTF